ncbi:MAG: RNA methyltransferase [Candidatus Saccharimonadales bacterium]
MKSITSSHNPLFKELKAIATTNKARREYGQTLLEGLHLTQSYLDKGLKPELCIVSEASAEHDDVVQVVQRAAGMGVQRLMISNAQYKMLSSVENGIGVLLLVAIPDVSDAPQLSDTALLLDGVQDPGNMGAILRTAAAAGVTTIYCSQTTTAAWSPKVLRVGMVAHVGLTIYESVDLAALVAGASVPVFATTLQATQSIYQADLTQPAAWIVGNEGQGVSDDLLTDAVTQVIIPQSDGVESLNVAAATAVCLFEQRRQAATK